MQIGINVVSIPWIIFLHWGMEIATWLAKWAGFEGIQALPVRSVRRKMDLTLPIWALEKAWNPTTFKRHRDGLPGASGEPTKWHDVLLFPSPAKALSNWNDLRFSLLGNAILLIQHDWEGVQRASPSYVEGFERRRLLCPLEIHKDMGLSLSQVVQEVTRNRLKLVLDTAHCRQPQVLAEWGSFRDILTLRPAICMVHLQGESREEWSELLDHRSGYLAECLRDLKSVGYQGPIVLEFNPLMFGVGYLLNPLPTLIRLRERVQELTS